jgi:16S rRNA (adenine1518-N6/adenine1519-N6)-dimethyltransferase
MQTAFEARLVRRVPPSAFRPPPRVSSAVVVLTPRPPLLPEALEPAFLAHVKGLFTRRRKLMLSGLRPARAGLAPSAWDALEALVASRRAETLSPAEHLEVFRLLHDLPPSAD